MTENKMIGKHDLGKALGEIVGPSHVFDNEEQWSRLGFRDVNQKSLLVSPGSVEEVQEVMLYANRNKTSVTPVGGGTRIGQVLGSAQSNIVLSSERLNALQEFESDNLSVTVQAGLCNESLQQTLKTKNLFFPVYPDMNHSSLGGEVARNFSSWKRYRHGNISDYVLGGTIVTPSGKVVKTGGKTVKNASGYDFTKLFAGSWGTIGIITSLILRLKPLPEQEYVVSAQFSSHADVLRAGLDVLGTKTAVSSLNIFGSFDSPGDASAADLTWSVVLEGSTEAVNDHLDKIVPHLGSNWQIDSQENVFPVTEKYRAMRAKLHTGRMYTVVFDKRVTKDLVPVLQLMTEEKVAFDLDLAAGVLEFTLENQWGPLPENILRQWQRLTRGLTHALRTNLESNGAQPLMGRILRRIDPSALMFPGNTLLEEVDRGKRI